MNEATDTEGIPQVPFSLPTGAVEVMLIRHGASAPVFPGVRQRVTSDGWGDPELAPEGLAQALQVADGIVRQPVEAIFVTPLRRTVETAAPLAERLGMEPREVEELAEIHLGEWEAGIHMERVVAGDPTWTRTLAEERWDVIPGAETMGTFAERVRDGVERISGSLHPGGVAVAFTHGGVIGEVCRQATGARPFAFVYADNASLTRLVCHADGKLQVRSFNETEHLIG